MKIGSCSRESKMLLSGPTLSSLAYFYIELEQFCRSLSIWNIMPDNKSSVFTMFFKTSQLAYGPEFILCVDHDPARSLC